MQYEALVEENTQMKKALISSKAVIERKINELETQIALNDELKMQLDKLKQENQELHSRTRQLAHERKSIEQQFDNTTKNWRLLIEQKQREIEEIQNKLIPTFDQDMMRIKIINELEQPHRQQLEQKQIEIEKLNETIYQLKRKVDIEIAKAETITLENQKQNKLFQERHQLDLDDLNHQIQELTKIIEDNKDKEVIRRLRKDLDEYKQKFQTVDAENEELRGERDRIREEKNELMIKFARQIDSERNDKRQFKGEADKLNVRVRFLDEELRKEKQRREQLLTDFELLKSEREQQNNDLRKKDDTIHYLQRKITELEEDQLESEQKVQDKMTRLYSDEHDKYLQERNKAVTLQKDFDNMKKRYGDLSDDYKILKDRYLKESMDWRDQNKQNNEEIEKLKKTVSLQQKDILDFERSVKLKEEQLHDLENEGEALKRRNRELQHRIQLIEINPLPMPLPMPLPVQQPQIVPPMVIQAAQTSEPVEKGKQPSAQKENQRAQNLSLQQVSEENRELVAKLKKLHKKLQQANEKILELQLKNSVLEKQLQQHHQQTGFIPAEPPMSLPQEGTFRNEGAFLNDGGFGNDGGYRNEGGYRMEGDYGMHGNYGYENSNPHDFRTKPKERSYKKGGNRAPAPQPMMGQQQMPAPYPGIVEDDVLNKVMRLTEASTKQVLW